MICPNVSPVVLIKKICTADCNTSSIDVLSIVHHQPQIDTEFTRRLTK